MKKDWRKNYVAVSEPKIGVLYHLKWARNSGYVWRLMKINNNGTCEMETPKTHIKLSAKLSDLLHLKKTSNRILNGQNETP